MKTLITGFGVFPHISTNPTELLISRLRGSAQRDPAGECEYIVLPTEYKAAADVICDLLSRYDPGLVIMTGVMESKSAIHLERYALNIDDCTTADAAGEVREGREIKPGAATALKTGVDLIALCNSMVARDYSVRVSNHAGTYVCNHAYYTALDFVLSHGRMTDVLFVHVPMHPLIARHDIFEGGSLRYLESALHEIRRLLERNNRSTS